jgi:glycosyltransferase involved in cell wall biosynthesis
MHGKTELERALYQAKAVFRRALVPDENVAWNLTAIPHALRIVRSEGIDAVVTTSPPNSVHFIGAAVKAGTDARWVADLRDPIVAFADRNLDRLTARARERVQTVVAKLVAGQADAIVTAWDGVADEIRTYEPNGPVKVIENGCDFEDFAGLEYRPTDRFRITHTGSFLGHRDPRPFLTALRQAEADVVARFVGDFRKSDLEWVEELALGDRLELLGYRPRAEALRLQRDSEALLMLLPQAGDRGSPVLPGKVFEYLAAERPILAAVPPDGAAARLIRETGAGVVVAPDDVRGIADALSGLHARWRAGKLDGSVLSAEQRDRLSRRRRVEELAELLLDLAG